MIACFLALFIVSSQAGDPVLGLPVHLTSRIEPPNMEDGGPIYVHDYLLISNDGYRGFKPVRRLNFFSGGSQAVEFWPQSWSSMHVSLSRQKDGAFMAGTSRQWIAYRSSRTLEQQLDPEYMHIDAKETVLSASSYKDAVFLLSVDADAGGPMSFIFEVDIDALGHPKGKMVHDLGPVYAAIGVADRAGAGFLYRVDGSWHFIDRAGKKATPDLAENLDIWALDFEADVIVAKSENDVELYRPAGGEPFRRISPPVDIAGRQPGLLALALLKGGRIIAGYDYHDQNGRQVALYEISPVGAVKPLGPFQLCGASVDGSALYLGHALANTTRRMVWPIH